MKLSYRILKRNCSTLIMETLEFYSPCMNLIMNFTYIQHFLRLQKAVCNITNMASIPSSYTQMPAQATEYALAGIALPPEVGSNSYFKYLLFPRNLLTKCSTLVRRKKTSLQRCPAYRPTFSTGSAS